MFITQMIAGTITAMKAQNEQCHVNNAHFHHILSRRIKNQENSNNRQ